MTLMNMEEVTKHLTNLLLTPPRGRATKWIGKHQVCEDVVSQLLLDGGGETNLDSAISQVLHQAQRNHYAYKGSIILQNSNFIKCNQYSSHHYSPIIWYVTDDPPQRHFVTDKKEVDSVAARGRGPIKRPPRTRRWRLPDNLASANLLAVRRYNERKKRAREE
jgi:hypothetical protein